MARAAALSQAIHNALRMRYAEAHRIVHGWAHVEMLLRLLEWQQARVFNLQAAELAILFHDAVFEPLADDNQARSARLMRGMIHDEVAPVTLEAAGAIILALGQHRVAQDAVDPLLGDTLTVLDCHAALLAVEPETFAALEQGLRDEHAMLPDADYAARRRGTLERLLARPAIFETAPFGERFETRARANLADRLTRLAAMA
jgi:predicted metal-dependent HD superfamily phosphohydrolase